MSGHNWTTGEEVTLPPSCSFNGSIEQEGESLAHSNETVLNWFSRNGFEMEEIKKDIEESELTKGWNTLYVTDFGKPVRFYVRGGEFTSQLDYFIDCILKEAPGKICNFEDGLVTDTVISNIFKNGAELANG